MITPPQASLDEVHFDSLEVGDSNLGLLGLLVFAGRPVVARAVRVGTAAGLYRSFGGEQRRVDVLTDVLDVGRALQHIVVAAPAAPAMLLLLLCCC